MPKDIEPMLATLVTEPIEEKGWLYEMKWDGYRALLEPSDDGPGAVSGTTGAGGGRGATVGDYHASLPSNGAHVSLRTDASPKGTRPGIDAMSSSPI